MTAHKHFKHLVRSRMSKTGESYTTARRHVLQQVQLPADGGPGRFHMPGSIPGSTALRILLTAAGVRDPHSGKPLSEAMVFGIAGGIGIGIAAFHYEKGDFSSFYITGRHLWQDHVAYFKAALKRFGIEPIIRETSGSKGAEKQLVAALAQAQPCIAWGRGYQIITVYAADTDKSVALIGDLADAPAEKPLDDLASWRGEIKSYKNRLLSIAPSKSPADLSPLVRDGLRACCEGFTSKISKGPKNWSTLESLKIWANRLHGSKDKESWARIFPRGHLLWQGLTSIHDFIEHCHTGGGLSRPMFAEFLMEASELSKFDRLRSVADQYAKLGNQWTELAQAALPEGVPAFQKARELWTCQVEERSTGDTEGNPRAADLKDRIAALAQEAREKFPLSESQCSSLLESLQKRVMALYDDELAAHAALSAAIH